MIILDLPKLDIKPACEADIVPVAEFMYFHWREQYEGRLPDELVQQRTVEYFENYLKNQAQEQTWVAWFGNRCVGMVSIAVNCIEELWVKRKYRRRGIASKLLQPAMQRIASRGYQQVQIGVEDFNHQAIKFLAANGWEMIAAQKIVLVDELGTQALVFTKPATS